MTIVPMSKDVPAKITPIMGTPVAKLFFDPQKTIVMQSSRGKRNFRENQYVADNTIAKNTAQENTTPTNDHRGNRPHNPCIAASLNEVYTTSQIVL